MQFSIIVPIYNVSKYVESCLLSLLYQTCQDFEVILVNDGSTDHVEEILLPYVKQHEKLHYFEKKNGGLSDTRNYGLLKVKGDYILFLDSDDTIDTHLLENLRKEIHKHPNVDILKFQCRLVDEAGNLIIEKHEQPLPYQDMKQAFSYLLDSSTIELSCLYAYRSEFWKKYNFTFALQKYHEDFGLTPYILILAKDVIRLDFMGYNYLQRHGSIMNSTDNNTQRSEDMIYHFDRMYAAVNQDTTIDESQKNLLFSFIANALISRAGLLKGADLQKYIVELQKRHIEAMLMHDTITRKVKYMIFKLNFRAGIRCFAKSK